ncbi:MAG: serine/threonine protein kinase, partial [Elusimicrobiota bacterium]|nr:serine/threonine protein kinase [Elusimicrobiota bacterium]
MAEEENKPAQPPQPQEAPPAQSASGAPSTPSTPQTAPQRQPELGLIGQEISGCVILEKVSEGGMGTVFKAKHKALDRIVCVKILSPALSNDKKAVGLFLTEARAIAEIDHPNIVFVYNVGREKGFYFIVMSFIEGESLSSIVRKKPNLPLSFIVDTFIGILRGLEAAHQKGIIHRDIKPSNI